MGNEFDYKNYFEEFCAKIKRLRDTCEDQAIKISDLNSLLISEKARNVELEQKVSFLSSKLEELREENLMMKEKLDNFYFEGGR